MMTVTRRKVWFAVAVLSCAVGATMVFLFVRPLRNATAPESTPGQTVSPVSIITGEQTTILPTLNTPLPEGQSAVWCASFQRAWDRLKADVTHGPVQVRHAEVIAERLNGAQVPEADLQTVAYIAIAGAASEGVADTIDHEMASRFPDAERPSLKMPPEPEAICAFAFLSASVPWRYEYHDNPQPLDFTDAAGRRTPVRSFGILEEDLGDDWDADYFRGQVALLWDSEDTHGASYEFAVDLCRHSTPYQVVLARVARKATLEDTLADLEREMRQKPPNEDQLGAEDTLLVPTMHWRIEQHFKELEGPDKVLTNGPTPDLYLAAAFQAVQFRIDRRGAEVLSGGHFVFGLNGGARHLHFDRPFLLYVKHREAQRPFLVMWIENAELLQPY